jgi:hypothetical protein
MDPENKNINGEWGNQTPHLLHDKQVLILFIMDHRRKT